MSDPRRPESSLRDPVLDAAWRSHSVELPPERVDAAILAAAHREAHARPHAVSDDGASHARRPARAWWGFAAAAAIGAVAFGVVQLAPPHVEKPDAVVATDVPPPAMPSVPPAPPPVAALVSPPPASEPVARARESRLESQSPRKAENAERSDARVAAMAPPSTPTERELPGRNPQRFHADASSPTTAPLPDAPAVVERAPSVTAPLLQSTPQPFPAAPAKPATAPPVAAAPAPSIAAAPALPSDIAKTEPGAFAAPRSEAAAGAGLAAPAERSAAARPLRDMAKRPAQARQMLSAEAWIERIRALHAQQRYDEAARELNAFREAYPGGDSQLPAPLAAWAAGVKREPR